MTPFSRQRDVVNCLRERGPQTLRELGAATGLVQNDINKELHAMLAEKRVEREEVAGFHHRTKQNQFRWKLCA